MIVALSFLGVYGPFDSVKEARDWVMAQKYKVSIWTIRKLNPVTH
jgi:hypothetical protein